jgi:hypothetical protein
MGYTLTRGNKPIIHYSLKLLKKLNNQVPVNPVIRKSGVIQFLLEKWRNLTKRQPLATKMPNAGHTGKWSPKFPLRNT